VGTANQRPTIVHGEIKEERFEGCDRTIESALSLPLQGADGPVGVLNLARSGAKFCNDEMMALARLVHPLARRSSACTAPGWASTA